LLQVDDVITFFAKFITEWNENKTTENENKHDHRAADVNQAEPHPAALSTEALLDLLRQENATARYDYYCRAVRKEHIHDFHFPNTLEPPNPSQPCARRLKGKLNVWYCANAYPRDVVKEEEEQSVTQDALRPDLFRAGLVRNDPLMNPHCPIIAVAAQSNDDAQPVITRHAAEMYACKYVTKHTKNAGERNVMYEVVDDMERRDAANLEKFGKDFEPAVLGPKIHRAFMDEVADEFCATEVAHHENNSPEYLMSRPEKHVHFYKAALRVQTEATEKDGAEEEGEDEEQPAGKPRKKKRRKQFTPPSDVEIYEQRGRRFKFAADAEPWEELGSALESPDEQVKALSAYDFFRYTRFVGGASRKLAWDTRRPIVCMSPVVKLAEGAGFAFGARWALMHNHPWDDRRQFLAPVDGGQLSESDVKKYFRGWVRGEKDHPCPWYVREEYEKANRWGTRGGAGKTTTRKRSSPGADAEYYEQRKKEVGDMAAGDMTMEEMRWQLEGFPAGSVPEPKSGTDSAEENSSAEQSDDGWNSVVEDSEEEEEKDEGEQESLRVLKLLMRGNVQESSREAEQKKNCKEFNHKHTYYRNSRVTSVAQEDQSAIPLGVQNVYEDSDDADAYQGEQKEIAKEMDQLRYLRKLTIYLMDELRYLMDGKSNWFISGYPSIINYFELFVASN